MARQRGVFRRGERFKCPRHLIYISPSMFEYQSELDNILWREKAGLGLLGQVKAVKRESRIARDNSEDAVTWNVFRLPEREDFMLGFLSMFTRSSVGSPEVIYWTYSRLERGPWSHLVEARKACETMPRAGSELDVIVRTDRELFFIEPKLISGNDTVPHSKRPDVQRKYESGGGNWYRHVFNSGFKIVAVSEKKYEMVRFWLIGSWVAKRLNLDFYLVNLMPSHRERKRR